MKSKLSYTVTVCFLFLLAGCEQNNETGAASEPVQQATPKTEEIIQSDEVVESTEPESPEPTADQNEISPENLGAESTESPADAGSAQPETVETIESTTEEIDTAESDAAATGNGADAAANSAETTPATSDSNSQAIDATSKKSGETTTEPAQ